MRPDRDVRIRKRALKRLSYMMRSILPFSSALLLASLAALSLGPVGCAAPAEDVGASDHADTTAAGDLADAQFAVALLGGTSGRCSGCHGVTQQKLQGWGNAMKDVEAKCFAPPNLTAAQRVDCLRSTPGQASSPFAAKRLGLYAAGAGFDQFKKIFSAAFPSDPSQYAGFTHTAGMPRSGAPLTQDEFSRVKAWALRGMPQLAAAFNATPQPTACTPKTTPELQAHIADMKATGWGARLADASTPMFGCASGAPTTACLSDKPDATSTFGNTDVPQMLRTLHKQKLKSHYWVRSSADGRYVGYGMDDSASIVDLTKPDTAPEISVEADYDPYFLPSNDGFAFAGSHSNGGITLCRQSLLSDVGSAAAPAISLDESKCSAVGENVYMSIGTALDQSRYFMTFGLHENDDGGNDVTSPLPAAFGVGSTTIFTPMVNDGLSYKPQPQVTVSTPFEGDMMLSPSSEVAATVFGDGRTQLGYRLRFVKPQTNPAGAVASIDLPLAAEVCMRGQKPNISFDERFLVSHQYVDNTAPGEAGLPLSSSNIVMTDLLTGNQFRVTTMKAGQFALYPHFRADGWLYFAVRDMNAKVEYLVATDIAVRQPAQ